MFQSLYSDILISHPLITTTVTNPRLTHLLHTLSTHSSFHSRTSVLAAANPIFGHYDDTKSVGDNIDLMTTILSRFDCIFIVRDVRDMERDRNIARHVLGNCIQSFLHNIDI